MALVFDLNDQLRRHTPEAGAFERFLEMDGTVHRQVKHRRTIDFTVGGRRYFIKIHHGCGWKEILKDLIQARSPVISARNEWQAIERLTGLGIPTLTLAGKGLRGWNPARLESFVITEALEGMISVEDLVRDWKGVKGRKRRLLQRALVGQLARLAKRMHQSGLNHRDFYLCHFLLKDRPWKEWAPGDPLELHVIDLHRMQCRAAVPRRWVIKDLAALLCSSFDWGVTRRDLALFVRVYAGKRWGELGEVERRFWRTVWRRAWSLFAGFYKRQPPRIR